VAGEKARRFGVAPAFRSNGFPLSTEIVFPCQLVPSYASCQIDELLGSDAA
jgi:hypothetical protein